MSVRSNTRPIPRRGLSREEAATYIGVSPSSFNSTPEKDGRIGSARLIDGRKVWNIYQLDQSFDVFPLEGGDIIEDWSTAV